MWKLDTLLPTLLPMLKEQPSIPKPVQRFNLKEDSREIIYGRFICSYCGYQSTTSIHAMKHHCVVDDYEAHLAGLRELPIMGSHSWSVADKLFEGVDFKIITSPSGAAWIISKHVEKIPNVSGFFSRENLGGVDPEEFRKSLKKANDFNWRNDYKEACKKDITLPQYEKAFAEWLDKWVEEKFKQL